MPKCCICQSELGDTAQYYLLPGRPVCKQCKHHIDVLIHDETDDTDFLKAYNTIHAHFQNDIQDGEIKKRIKKLLNDNTERVDDANQQQDNSKIGNTLIRISFTFACIGTICCFVAGLYFLSTGSNYKDDVPLLITGIIIAIVGPFLCWVASLPLRGFGVLINNSEITKKATLEMRDALQKLADQNDDE